MNMICINTTSLKYSMISSKDRNLIHWDNNQMNIQQAYEKLDQTDLSAVVVCTGPGRYAGIRTVSYTHLTLPTILLV